MITEQQIDNIISSLERKDTGEILRQECFNKFGPYFDYAKNDSEILFDEELDYMFSMLCLIILSAFDKVEALDLDHIQELEEKNWETLYTHKSIKSTFDVYFEGYEEEDLLAYVEDALVFDKESEEEMEFLTNVGTEVIMVKAKSLIDYSIELSNVKLEK